MITCKEFPNKEFATTTELYAELRKNEKSIIAIKKAETQESFRKGYQFDGFLTRTDGDAAKVGPHMKEGFIYPVINTTKYMDSHRDVHFDGIWNKSIKDQAGKLFYVTDHEVKIDTVIAWPSDVNAMVKSVPWSFIGKDFEGNTEALIYEIDKAKIVHAKALEIINEKRPVQNSVRMRYVRIKLAMNSAAPEDKEYKAYYDSRINEIANKDQVAELGYFWGVEEAKIETEGSMVIRGSNDATPIRQKDEAADSTSEHKDEPVETTQTKQLFYHDLI